MHNNDMEASTLLLGIVGLVLVGATATLLTWIVYHGYAWLFGLFTQ